MNLAQLSMQTEEAGFVSLFSSMQELDAINLVDGSEMQAATDMANKTSQVCDVIEDAQQATVVLESLKIALESGELDSNKHAIRAVCIAVEHIKSTLGYTQASQVLSSESIGDVAKGIGDFIATIFKAILGAIKKLIEFILNFIKWMFGIQTGTNTKKMRYESAYASRSKQYASYSRAPNKQEIDTLAAVILSHVYSNVGRIADGSVTAEYVIKGAVGHKAIPKEESIRAVHSAAVGVHVGADRARLGDFENISKLPDYLKGNVAVFNEILAGLEEYFAKYEEINQAVMGDVFSKDKIAELSKVTQEDLEANRQHLIKNFISLPLIKHPVSDKTMAGEADLAEYKGSTRVTTSKKIFGSVYLRATYTPNAGIGKVGLELKEEKSTEPLSLRYIEYNQKILLKGLSVLDGYKVGTSKSKADVLRKCMARLESYERFFSSGTRDEQSARVRHLAGFMKEALHAYATVLSRGIIPLDHMAAQTKGAVYEMLTSEINLEHQCRMIAINCSYQSLK